MKTHCVLLLSNVLTLYIQEEAPQIILKKKNKVEGLTRANVKTFTSKLQ